MSWSSTLPTGSISKSSSHCTTMQTFQNSLIGKQATSVTVEAGSSTDTCSTAAVANQIIQKFATCTSSCTSQSFSCDGETWWVGICGGGEISVGTGGICRCSSQLTIRPCIGNSNWGGGSGKACGASSQTLSIKVI